MSFIILVFITALVISFIAAYYSIAGLIAIFASAAIPVAIMGSALEVAKLVSASWLYRYWNYIPKLIKIYLTTAVVILMFITSMGIFGFLSKAHVEQTSAGIETIAKVQRIENEINKFEDIIARSESRIDKLENSGTGGQNNIQAQIDKEQERIDSAYTRIQPLIDEQNFIIKNSTSFFKQELLKIDTVLSKLQEYIDQGEIAKAQGLIGTKADGKYGPATAQAFKDFQEEKNQTREEWILKIQNAESLPSVVAAKEEIIRLRRQSEDQIADSNSIIQKYQEQLQDFATTDVGSLIDEELKRIKNANQQIDQLTSQKYDIQSEYRKLEAEVGPIKYIAEFVYGEDANKNLLERAVRWVTIIIIFVFDPLAVLLLIAANMTLINRNKWIENEEFFSFNTLESKKKESNQLTETTVKEKKTKKEKNLKKPEIIKEKEILNSAVEVELDNNEETTEILLNGKATKVFLNRPAQKNKAK